MKNKHILIFLFQTVFFAAFAQDSIPKIRKNEKYSFCSINLGVQNFNAVNNSAVADGLDFETGLEGTIRFYFTNGFAYGFLYSNVRGKVAEPETVGTYDHANISFISVLAGYRKDFLKFAVAEIDAGIGYARYRNRIPIAKDFTDNGWGFFVRPELAFMPTKGISLFVAYNFRADRLDIKTSPAKDDYFNQVNYSNISLGIRFDSYIY